MIEVYNTVLQLAGAQTQWMRGGADVAPRTMPQIDQLMAAIEAASSGRHVEEYGTTDTIRRSLLRICAINDLVREHAREYSQLGYLPKNAIVSGEMPCPECNRGSLCYLVNPNSGVFVECSTVGCLYWDSRSPA